MQHRIGGEILADPAIERAERMRRREPALKQQPHRVALEAERRLQAHEHIAELLAEHEDRGAIGVVLARRRAPGGLDLVEPGLLADMIVERDPRADRAVHAVGLAAVDHQRPQRVDVSRHIDRVARLLHRRQRVEQALEHREIRRRAGGAGIGRKVEQHDGDLARRPLGATQPDQLAHAPGQCRRPLLMDHHVARAAHAVAAVAGLGRLRPATTPAEHHRADRPIKLRDRDHHRGLDRQQAAGVVIPLLERLEFDRTGRHVWHVQLRQHRLGGPAIVVGGPAHQREAGQRHDGIDDRDVVLLEIEFDRRP